LGVQPQPCLGRNVRTASLEPENNEKQGFNIYVQ
jgi:hypothetical protein